jgi:hypothetical protein
MRLNTFVQGVCVDGTVLPRHYELLDEADPHCCCPFVLDRSSYAQK